MSIEHKAGLSGDSLSSDSIVDYLLSHPEFFEAHPELLVKLKVPHPSGTAVSLIERQVEVLRGQNRQLERKLVDLIEVARANDTLIERIHRLGGRLGNDKGDAVADPADILFRQHRITRRMHRLAAAPLEARISGQVAVTGGLDIRGGEHREHARRGLGGFGVDRNNFGIGVRRAQHDTECHSGINDVVDEVALALYQLRILETRYALTDCEFTHCRNYLSISGVTER